VPISVAFLVTPRWYHEAMSYDDEYLAEMDRRGEILAEREFVAAGGYERDEWLERMAIETLEAVEAVLES